MSSPLAVSPPVRTRVVAVGLLLMIGAIVVACSGNRSDSGTTNPTEPPPSPSSELVATPDPAASEAPASGTAPLPATASGVRLVRLDPPSVRAGNGGRALAVTVFGTGVPADAQVVVGGAAFPTTVVNDLSVTASIAADRLAAPGPLPLALTSGDPLARSNEVVLTVVDPNEPGLELSPSSANARGAGNTAPLSLVVRGGGFEPTSVVVFDGADVPTAFRGATRLDAAVPANVLGGPRRLHVVVRRASGLTAPAAFTVLSSGGGGGTSSGGTGASCGGRGRCADTGMKPGECVGDFPAYRCGEDGCLTLVPGC